MALSYTIHGTPDQVTTRNNNVATFPWTGTNSGQRNLASATNSAAIVGPCIIRLYADEVMYVDIEPTTAALDTSTTPYKIGVGTEWMIVDAGTFYLKWVAA
jgi:hypothetical protein